MEYKKTQELKKNLEGRLRDMLEKENGIWKPWTRYLTISKP